MYLQLAESYSNPVKSLSRTNFKITWFIFHRKVFSSIPFALSHFYFLCARFIVSRRERGSDPNIHKVDYKYCVTPVHRAWLTKNINHFVAEYEAPHCGGRYVQVTKLIPLPEIIRADFPWKRCVPCGKFSRWWAIMDTWRTRVTRVFKYSRSIDVAVNMLATMIPKVQPDRLSYIRIVNLAGKVNSHAKVLRSKSVICQIDKKTWHLEKLSFDF